MSLRSTRTTTRCAQFGARHQGSRPHHSSRAGELWMLNHTTNVSGLRERPSPTPRGRWEIRPLAIAGDDCSTSQHRRQRRCDLRYYTDETGVQTNETVYTGSNTERTPSSPSIQRTKWSSCTVMTTAKTTSTSAGNGGSTSSLVAQNLMHRGRLRHRFQRRRPHQRHSAGTGFYCCNKDMNITNAMEAGS